MSPDSAKGLRIRTHADRLTSAFGRCRPFEAEVPCLTIGQVDPKEEESLILAMLYRSYDAIAAYKADPYYKKADY